MKYNIFAKSFLFLSNAYHRAMLFPCQEVFENPDTGGRYSKTDMENSVIKKYYITENDSKASIELFGFSDKFVALAI